MKKALDYMKSLTVHMSPAKQANESERTKAFLDSVCGKWEDNSFLAEGANGQRDSIERIGVDQCHISEITYAELLYGTEGSSEPAKRMPTAVLQTSSTLQRCAA